MRGRDFLLGDYIVASKWPVVRWGRDFNLTVKYIQRGEWRREQVENLKKKYYKETFNQKSFLIHTTPSAGTKGVSISKKRTCTHFEYNEACNFFTCLF